jgi:predicted TPR repeat methyltransferase
MLLQGRGVGPQRRLCGAEHRSAAGAVRRRRTGEDDLWNGAYQRRCEATAAAPRSEKRKGVAGHSAAKDRRSEAAAGVPPVLADGMRAIALGADDELHRYYLASVRGGNAPDAPPREYVETLFDSYADDFQGHLTGALRYQAHEVLVRNLPPRAARWPVAVGAGPGLRHGPVRPDGARAGGRAHHRRGPFVAHARAGRRVRRL